MHQLSIKSPTGHGGDASVELDGVKLTTATDIGFHVRADGWAVATIEFLMPTTDIDGKAVIEVSEANAAQLLALGWTPPKPADG